MRKLSVATAVLAMGLMTSLAAAAPGVPPAPGVGQTAAPAPVPDAGPQKGVALYHCVKVKDPHHVHPCAVPKIVKIVDPCYRPCQPCSCCRPCAPPCVYVKICVPPCGCARVKCSKDGRKVKYDYGKYRVELTSKNGVVTVDYDD